MKLLDGGTTTEKHCQCTYVVTSCLYLNTGCRINCLAKLKKHSVRDIVDAHMWLTSLVVGF